MCRYLLLITLFLSSIGGFAQFIKNDVASTAIKDLGHGAADWGDFDNDGDLDLAIVGGGGGLFARIYRNDDGAFVDINANLKEADASSLMWGDFDNDGDLDLLYSGQSNEGVGVDRVTIIITRIYRNDNGIFTDHGANLIGTRNGSTEWGDFDNDGDLDIAMTGSTIDRDYILKIYRNDNGVFTDLSFPVQPNHTVTGSLNWGDYDNDNDLDLLVTGLGWNEDETDYVTTVFRNDDGIFVDAGINLPGLVDSKGKWGDYDNDGDLDIVLAGSNYKDQDVSYVYQNTNGEFNDIGAPSVSMRTVSVVWVDYDTDHDLDLIISGFGQFGVSYAPTTSLFKNNNGTFVDATTDLPPTWGEVVPGDYDNDGDPDILLFEVDGIQLTNIYDNVLKEAQTITFDPLPTKTYGDAEFELVATSSSALPISFEIVSGPGILINNTVTITGAGDIVIEATQPGSVDFNPAHSVQQTFLINKAGLTAIVDDKAITYGDALPALTFSYSGFVNEQDATALIAEPTISTVATANSDAGTYAISLSGGSAANYAIMLIDGFLTIDKANATVIITDLEQIFDGTEKEATITTNPTGLGYSATYNGSEVLPIASDSYDLIVTVSDINYVGQSSATFLIQLILGSEDDLKNNITIYPVPSDQEIHFKGGLNNLERVQIHTLNGQIMLDEAFVKRQRLDISHIPAGSYILSLVDRNGTRKLTQTILIK